MSFYFCPICQQRHRGGSGKGSAHEDFSSIFNETINKYTKEENELEIKFMNDLVVAMTFAKYTVDIPDHLIDFVKRLHISKNAIQSLLDKEVNKPENKDIALEIIISYLVLESGTEEDKNRLFGMLYDINKNIQCNEDNEKITIFVAYNDNYDFNMEINLIYDYIYLNNKTNNTKIRGIRKVGISLILNSVVTNEKKYLDNTLIDKYNEIEDTDIFGIIVKLFEKLIEYTKVYK